MSDAEAVFQIELGRHPIGRTVTRPGALQTPLDSPLGRLRDCFATLFPVVLGLVGLGTDDRQVQRGTVHTNWTARLQASLADTVTTSGPAVILDDPSTGPMSLTSRSLSSSE